MALPTAPTASSIVEEALSRLNEPNISADMQTRGQDILLGVINRVAKRGSWRVLEETKSIILTAYQPRYVIPADFNKGVDLRLFSGGYTGTMQSASPSTITLAAAEPVTAVVAQGSPIFMLTGNAAGYFSRIVSYNFGTKQATISPSWGLEPTSGNYLIPAEELELPYNFNTKPRLLDSVAKPLRASVYDDEIYLSPVPNSDNMALLARYQVKVHKIDLTDARFTNVYWDWREALILGVIRDWAYQPDDDRYKQATEDFEQAVLELTVEEKRRGGF